MKIRHVTFLTAVSAGTGHIKAELDSMKMLDPAELTKIDPHKVRKKTFLSRTIQECNLDENECTAQKDCKQYEIEDCTPVYCIDDYVCQFSTIKNSSVFCQDFLSCGEATMKDSSVDCLGSFSCQEAKFFRSTVRCTGDIGSVACAGAQFQASAVSCLAFESCKDAAFDSCSCLVQRCTDYSCPKWLHLCTINGNPSEEFCSMQSNGVTCAALGNPMCKDMPGYIPPQENESPPPSSPTTSTPVVDSPTHLPSTSVPAMGSPTGPPTTSAPTVGSFQEGSSTVNPAAYVVPVVVAVIGLIIAFVNRNRIVHHFHHMVHRQKDDQEGFEMRRRTKMEG